MTNNISLDRCESDIFYYPQDDERPWACFIPVPFFRSLSINWKLSIQKQEALWNLDFNPTEFLNCKQPKTVRKLARNARNNVLIFHLRNITLSCSSNSSAIFFVHNLRCEHMLAPTYRLLCTKIIQKSREWNFLKLIIKLKIQKRAKRKNYFSFMWGNVCSSDIHLGLVSTWIHENNKKQLYDT